MPARQPDADVKRRENQAVADADNGVRVRTAFDARRPILLLVLALVAFGIAAWAERHQRHSHRWTIAGDRFLLTSFLAPWHHHTREIPWSGIDRITGEPHPDRPEETILVLQYGLLSFRMPSQSDRDIRDFDAYVARLQRLLEGARAGDDTATVMVLDPFFAVTVAAAMVSLTAWILLFTVLAGRPRSGGD